MAKKITQIEINGETYNVGGSGESVSGNFINQVDDFSQYVPTKWNEIAQYVGTDTPQYKNGYFYKNSGSWIIPADSQQIAYQSISEGGEHAIPIVSPLYEGLLSRVFVGSNAYYGMLGGNTPTVGGKIFDFLTGTINTITAVTDNGDETYICVTDGGAREETTTYTLDMTEEFDYNERVDAYKNRFIVIEYTDISDYPSSMLGFYIVEETDPNTGTLVENFYPAGLNGCVVTRTTAPVVIDIGTWTRIDVQPTSSSGGSNALVGFILANNKVSIVPLVDCYIENGNLYDPTTHEQLYPTSDTYYYEINEEKVYTPDESYELVDVTNSVLIQPSVNQIVIEIRGNEAFRWNGLSYNQIVDSTKAPDVPTFSEAQTRENIKGDGTENTATLWGKIKKWFSDLKDLAFIGKPSANQTTTYLRGDGTWQAPPDTTYSLSATNEKVTLTPSQGSASNVSLNTLINGLSIGNSDPVDTDYYVSQYVNGGTTTTTYHRRPMSAMWNWIKTKLGIGTNDGTFLRKDGTWATPSGTTYSAGQGLVKNGSTFKIGSGTNAHLSKHAAKSGDYILITINDYNAWMLSFKVRFYGDYKCDEYIISGYNYGYSYWYSPSVVLISSSGENRDVKFGYTALNHLWVAIPNADYYGVDVLDVVCGYQQVNSYDGLFTLTETSSLSGTTQTTITISPLAKKSDIPSSLPANGGTASNVSGTVAIAHGGTGATTRLGALQNLTSEDVGTNAQYFLTITTNWGKGGYTSVANAKTVLGLGSAAYVNADTAASNNTIVKRTANGYINATYFNQSSGAETPTSSSYIMFCNSDGYLRKSSIANIKSLVDTNTWRPLGTGASDACAGNDSRLSNSRPASDVYAWAKSASLAAAMNSAISTGSVTSCTGGTCSINWLQIGDIVIFTGWIKPSSSYTTSGSVSAGMPGTYKRQEYFGGIQTNKSVVLRLTATGYIQNEGPVSSGESYYFQVVGIKVV